MTSHRAVQVHGAVEDAGLPDAFAAALVEDCPWLDGAVEVSESIGLELLSGQALRWQLSQDRIRRFIYAYNRRVAAQANPVASVRSEAYAAMAAALMDHGREDAFGDGDFWLNSDSFSTPTPTIVVFNGFRFSVEALQSLQRIVSAYSSAFIELRICSEEAAEIVTLRPR